MRTFNHTIYTTQPLNSTFNSPYVPLRNIIVYSMAAIITGTPNGTIKLQASNDPETNDTQINTAAGVAPAVGPTNWVDIANSTYTLSSSGETMWNVANYAIGYNYVRVVYTDSSGGTSTATLKLIYNGKGA